MSVSAEFLDRCAAETGFPPATLEKVIRLGELAGDVGRHPFLGEVLALKGGTALNLRLEEPPRLSVDLDFNYIGAVDRERMIEERPKVEAAVEELARRRSYRIQRSRDEHAGRKLYLHYRSAAGPVDRIEVDLNFLFRQPLGDVRRRELWQPGGLDRPRVPVVSLEELVVGKLLALIDRTAVRDAFDVTSLPETAAATLASTTLRPLFIALSATLNQALTEYDRPRLDWITDEMVEDQLAGTLTVDLRYTAAELRDGAWAVAAPLLDLEDAEREYVRTVNEEGLLRLDLLFEDAELAERLERHPALLWKVQNVREYRALNR
jgi:hypothetical protein